MGPGQNWQWHIVKKSSVHWPQYTLYYIHTDNHYGLMKAQLGV